MNEKLRLQSLIEIIKMCILKLTWLMSYKYISSEIDQCWDNE